MDVFGLVLELIFLALAIYLYLFSRGMIKFAEPMREKAEAFREGNAWWIRLGALFLMAIMIVNIVLHLKALL